MPRFSIQVRSTAGDDASFTFDLTDTLISDSVWVADIIRQHLLQVLSGAHRISHRILQISPITSGGGLAAMVSNPDALGSQVTRMVYDGNTWRPQEGNPQIVVDPTYTETDAEVFRRAQEFLNIMTQEGITVDQEAVERIKRNLAVALSQPETQVKRVSRYERDPVI